MEKIISLFVDEARAPGFITPGFLRVSVSLGDVKIGSWVITQSNKYAVGRELSNVRNHYEKAGYKAVGHWSLV